MAPAPAMPSPTTMAPAPATASPTQSPSAWEQHRGLNCYGAAGLAVSGKNPMSGQYTVEECKAQCMAEPQCVGVVVVNRLQKSNCWQRRELKLDECARQGDMDTWKRPEMQSPTTMAPAPATPSPTTMAPAPAMPSPTTMAPAPGTPSPTQSPVSDSPAWEQHR